VAVTKNGFEKHPKYYEASRRDAEELTGSDEI
jgi:hypothetical protein